MIGVYYVLFITLSNILFGIMPMWHVFGVPFPPATLLVGVAFVLRDYTQRSLGYSGALVAMLIGTCMTFLTVGSALAVASSAAFAFGEGVEMLTFTFLATRVSFVARVFVSVLVAAPFESAIFLAAVHSLTLPCIVVMTAAKLVCASVLFGRVIYANLSK